jgi:LacI family transcriptional regulator
MARTTIRDVARLAGVSIKTVSRVTNHDPDVAPATAERVRQAIAELGYRPNPFARSLRTGSDEAVGLVVESIADPFFGAVTDAVEQAAREAGMFLIIAGAGDTAKQERAVVLGLLHRSVRGLIIVPCQLDYGREQLPIGPGGVPVVFIDRTAGVDSDLVIIDNEQVAADATAHLLAHGHRRVAFVGTGIGRYPVNRRHDGYRRALAQAGIEPDPALTVSIVRSLGDDESPLGDILSLPDPATAVLSANAVASIAVVRELHRRDRTDVALLSFDDFPVADSLTPPVSVARQDPVRMGRSAFELVMRRIGGDVSPSRRIVARGSGEIPPPSTPLCPPPTN